MSASFVIRPRQDHVLWKHCIANFIDDLGVVGVELENTLGDLSSCVRARALDVDLNNAPKEDISHNNKIYSYQHMSASKPNPEITCFVAAVSIAVAVVVLFVVAAVADVFFLKRPKFTMVGMLSSVVAVNAIIFIGVFALGYDAMKC